ncbi:Rft-1-domain-containing protein [Lentinula aciculospora]|uniref:Man(5)GlcNAc(2)-PP-dolichol translocation protein RFT1 n=1 Tax=Lentinula aciculospora TaxID=153920 RepID=A0A9W9A4U8_9AGAR|nr:Rft-1-domain-containing protein [Lentinula aciculospora]
MSSAMSTLTSLMGLQLFTRLFTFILNQSLSRLASPIAYGIAAIQFELMLSTILFLSREGVRGALLRVKSASDNIPTTGKAMSDRKADTSAAMNVGFVPIILGVPLALGTSLLYLTSAGTETRIQPHFKPAVAVYVAAAVMELLAEPMHNMAMVNLKTHLRVRTEGVAITVKTVVTFLVLVYDARRGNGGGDLALLAFALGQFLYGFSLLVLYLREYRGEGLITRMKKNSSGIYFDRDVLALSMTMTSQSLVKHFLTEGDKFILSWFSPLQDQGGYALAVNYGSLIARIVFQPIEETLRLYFSKTLADVTSTSSSSSSNKRHLPALKKAADALSNLLQMQIIGSLFVLVFGTNYVTILLNVLLPPRYLDTSAPRVLEAWIWYIPVLAINGGLEAFIASVALTKDVNRQSRWMVLFTLVYITSTITFYRFDLGDAALVYANIINLSTRILYACHFTQKFFTSHNASNILKWQEALPPWILVAALTISALMINWSEAVYSATEIVRQEGRPGILKRPVLLHVAIGGILALFCTMLWAWNARRFLTLPQRFKSKTA